MAQQVCGLTTPHFERIVDLSSARITSAIAEQFARLSATHLATHTAASKQWLESAKQLTADYKNLQGLHQSEAAELKKLRDKSAKDATKAAADIKALKAQLDATLAEKEVFKTKYHDLIADANIVARTKNSQGDSPPP